MTPAEIIALEDVSARAWPAAETARLGGWRLNASGGHTGRANTCWTLETPDGPVAAAIAAVEAWYAARGLPPRFKTTDEAMTPADIEAVLTAQGYAAYNETLVMTGPVGGAAGEVVLSDEPDAAFQSVLFDALYRDVGDAEERVATLRRIPPPVAFARLDIGGVPAAVGAGAVEGAWIGLSVMRTRAAHRRKGLARRVVEALLDFGAQAGATRSYLQVEASNAPAIALYETCGFSTAYAYRYWARA